MSDFATELEACLPDLWRYAMSLARDRDLADDIVQDCLERAWRKRWMWRASQPIKPWLMKILLNTWRNHLRRAPVRAAAQSVELTPEIAPAVASTPEDRLHVAEITRRVATLPDDQREALLLVVVGGLSYADAAQALAIPQGTLMSRIARARARLREEPAVTAARQKIRSVT